MKNLRGLVKGCLKGQSKSQKLLYDRYAPKMMSICARYARNDAEAADVLQEGFIKVFDNLEKLKNPEQLESWISGIMVNTALEAFRHHKTHFGKEVEMPDHFDSGEGEDITSQMSLDELLALIQTLPDGYRMIFNLYAIEGYSHPEIAEKLNLSTGASKSQYARAKKLLQEKVMASQQETLKHSS